MDGKCTAANKDGAPCNAAPWKDGLCRWHHPELEAQRREGRRRGGQAKSNANRARRQLSASSLGSSELRGILGSTIAQVLNGSVEPGVGNCVANLVKAYAALDETARAEALQQRLDELERQTARSLA